jgi:hypothetical protein
MQITYLTNRKAESHFIKDNLLITICDVITIFLKLLQCYSEFTCYFDCLNHIMKQYSFETQI